MGNGGNLATWTAGQSKGVEAYRIVPGPIARPDPAQDVVDTSLLAATTYGSIDETTARRIRVEFAVLLPLYIAVFVILGLEFASRNECSKSAVSSFRGALEQTVIKDTSCSDPDGCYFHHIASWRDM